MGRGVVWLPRLGRRGSTNSAPRVVSGLVQDLKIDINPRWIDLCQVKRCAGERKYHNGRYLRFCTDHNCYAGDCDKRIREGEGMFCKKHTCQHAGCFNYAPYRGVDESGPPDRFCNQHKLGTCSRSGCREPQHRRRSGLVLRSCRRHCCTVKTCDGEKSSSQAGCPRHTCLEASCVDVVAQKKCYCERHACSSVGCPYIAVALSRCKNHKCKYAACSDEAGSSGYCREHEGREKAGLKRTRFDLQGTYYPTGDECRSPVLELQNGMIKGLQSEIDYLGPCIKMIQSRRGDTTERRCENPIHAGTNYCSTHLCEIRECREPKVDAFNYCALHKCTAPACERLRLNATSVQPWEMPVDNPIQFCHDHTCGQGGCRREGQGLFGLCTRHARCYVRGCNEETVMLSACRTRLACRRHAWGSDMGEVVERRRHMRERDRESDRDWRRYDDWGYNIYDSVYE